MSEEYRKGPIEGLRTKDTELLDDILKAWSDPFCDGYTITPALNNALERAKQTKENN